MTFAYVGIGANLGPREETLRRAVELLGHANGVEVVGVSELRETDPVGVVDQPPFLNGAVSVETTLSPRVLLDLLLEVLHKIQHLWMACCRRIAQHLDTVVVAKCP